MFSISMRKDKHMKQHQLKKIAAVAAALGTLSVAGTTMGASTTQNFDVVITLSSVCTLGAVTPLDITYTSMQGVAGNSTGGGFTVTCTQNYPFTFGLVAGAGGSAPGTAGNTGIDILDGVVALNYHLDTVDSGNALVPGGTGQGTTGVNFRVRGTVAAGQSGNCGSASCVNTGAGQNRTQTLVLNF
jgi:spore coat protein U-like protein